MHEENFLKNAEMALANRNRDQVVSSIQHLVEQKTDLGQDWLKAGQLALAVGELRLATKAAGLFGQTANEDVNGVIQQAGLYAEAGDLQRALKKVDSLIEQGISVPAVFHISGTIRSQIGELDTARDHLEKAVMLSPSLGITWYTLAAITDFSEHKALFKKLEACRQLLKQNNDLNYMYYQYALGKAYSDQKMYAQAERAYFEGAKVMLKQSRYNIENDKKLVETLALNFTQLARQNSAKPDNHGRNVLAILGLPRSGTTLLAQILGCHSTIAGTKEFNAMAPATMHLSPADYLNFPNYLDKHEEPEVEIRKISNLYLRLINEQFTDSGDIIDKSMSLNRYFGIWAQAFPSGKAIYIRRDDNDVAWSCYKTPFRERAEWSWHPKTVAAYIRNERMLLELWKTQFPERIFEVKYEDLVKQPQETLKGICTFLNIEFEAGMLLFHKSDAPVLTSSVGQVHQPINKLGMGESKHYAGFIKALND